MGASSPQVVVLESSRRRTWSRATFGTVGDCHTRPILMLDTTNNLVRVYATAPDSGCPFPGSAGTIFEKTSPMSNLSFAPGRGTPGHPGRGLGEHEQCHIEQAIGGREHRGRGAGQQ